MVKVRVRLGLWLGMGAGFHVALERPFREARGYWGDG